MMFATCVCVFLSFPKPLYSAAYECIARATAPFWAASEIILDRQQQKVRENKKNIMNKKGSEEKRHHE